MKQEKIKEFLKNFKHIDIEIGKKSFDSQGWVKIKNPFAEAKPIEDKIEFSYQPFSIKIKNGDKWNTLTPVYIHGIKGNK